MEYVVGVFEDGKDVNRTILGLEYNYFDSNDISIIVKKNVVMNTKTLDDTFIQAKKLRTPKGEFSVIGPITKYFHNDSGGVTEIIDVLENFGLLPLESKILTPYLYKGAFFIEIQALSAGETNLILEEFQKHNAIKTYRVRKGGDK